MKSLTTAVLLVTLGSCASSSPSQAEDESLNGSLETARQHIAQQEYERAMTNLQALRRNHPQNALVEVNMGIACLGAGDYPCATQAFLKASQLDKNNVAAKLNYGYALILQKKLKEARSVLTEIEQEARFPWMERVYVNHGLAWMEEGRCDEAMTKFKAALSWDPTFISAHYNMGLCHMRQGKYNDAITSLAKAMNFCSNCTDAALELAKAYAKAGKKDRAIAGLENLMKRNITSQEKTRTKDLLIELKR